MNKRLGTKFSYENILIIHGSQQALDLRKIEVSMWKIIVADDEPKIEEELKMFYINE